MDYGVAEGHFNETALAKSASAVYGIKNSTVSFVENNSFEQSIRRTVELFGVPFGNSTALSADKMAQRVAGTHKVCLVGDGGDEILIGYPRYKAILHHQRYSQLPKWLILIASQMSGLVPEKGGSATTIRRAKQFISNLNVPVGEAFLEWSTYLNNESISRATGSSFKSSFYDGLLDVFNIYGFDPILAASIVDLKSFVPYNLMQCADRTSMAHSLELRSPFLSTELIEYSLSIPSALKMKKGRTKPLLVDSLGEKLPEIIRNQPKRGFNPPLASFLNENMRALEDELVGNNSSLKNEIDLEFIKEEINAFKVGKRDNSTFLWGLSSLSSWLAT
jgi:asparagine synthase (glutamine-hydrolysing)